MDIAQEHQEPSVAESTIKAGHSENGGGSGVRSTRVTITKAGRHCETKVVMFFGNTLGTTQCSEHFRWLPVNLVQKADIAEPSPWVMNPNEIEQTSPEPAG